MPVATLLAGPPEEVETSEAEVEASGRLPALRASGFGFTNTNWLPTNCTVANAAEDPAARVGGSVAGGVASTQPGWEILRLLGRFRRLKTLLRRFEGRHNFHNFSPTADASDPTKAERTLLHCRCRGTVSVVDGTGAHQEYLLWATYVEFKLDVVPGFFSSAARPSDLI
jgi:tRNA U38,U39,U40 pseudouridine synthase TruA